MSRAVRFALALLAGTLCVAACPGCAPAVRRASGPLPQQAFVWQRAWTGSVAEAVAHRDPRLGALVVLAGEVEWRGNEPRIEHVAYRAEVLAATGGTITPALRFEVPPSWRTESAIDVARFAAAVVDGARAHGLHVDELMLDCDAPSSKLDVYAAWVAAARRAIAPARLTITALPAWLARQDAFARLARASDGFVLQVHSLAFAGPPDVRAPLCEPTDAQRWVEQAARAGVPFRVALPTYGYRVLSGAGGAPLALLTDGSPRPMATIGEVAAVDDVRADPAAMAGLVRAWTADRPKDLAGLVWYRLPLASDELNWSRGTLAAVMDGRAPRARFTVRLDTPAPGLVDITLVNEGEGDGPVSGVRLTIPGRVTAADGVRGFVPALSDSMVTFRGPRLVLRAGGAREVGWVRLAHGSAEEVTGVVLE